MSWKHWNCSAWWAGRSGRRRAHDEWLVVTVIGRASALMTVPEGRRTDKYTHTRSVRPRFEACAYRWRESGRVAAIVHAEQVTVVGFWFRCASERRLSSRWAQVARSYFWVGGQGEGRAYTRAIDAVYCSEVAVAASIKYWSEITVYVCTAPLTVGKN